jgi:hypothetical protein
MAVTPTNLRTNIAVGTTGQVAEVNTLHGAVNELTNAATGVVVKGEIVYRANDSASLTAAITAAPAGATILLSRGTFSASSITAASKDLTFIGDGPSSSIIDAASNTYGFSPPAAGTGARLTFRNIGFTGSTSAIVLLSRAVTYSARFIDCAFSGFTAIGIQTFGTNLVCVRCDFSSNGTPGTTNAIQHLRGAQSIIIKDCTFRYLNRGFYCTDTDGPATNVVLEGNLFDGGWMYLKATTSNSGGTVTYTATTVTDTAASLSALTASSTVRAMAVKRAGTITAISSTKVTDSAANFTTAGVLRGDIIRTATGWGVVDEVVSTTVLKIEEWLTLADYGPMPAPVTTTAYTIYGLVIGRVVSNTSTVVTVDAWRDWNGTIATPASDTLYELAPKSEYQCYIYRADKVRITNNTIRRAWADSISAQLVRNTVITDNNIYDCQDVGITIGQPSGQTANAIITGNRISHAGTAGIWAGNAYYSNISNNNIYEPNWMSLTSATYAGITVDGGSDNDISHNVIQRVLMPSATKAIHILGTTANMKLDLNTTLGYSTQDVMFTGGGVSGTTGRFQKDTKITLVTSAVGPVGDFCGAGTPESVLPAGIGSTYRRTNGGAVTSFYVKESGTGNTGWVAK